MEHLKKEVCGVEAQEIHARLLAMAKDFHKVCVENNIRYYIVDGTALGARRHKGFIPWDDDLDIGVPREDFERLSKLEDVLPDYLEMRWYRNTERSPFQFIKLVDNRTTLIETLYADYVEGLYIDIFPLDGAKKGSLLEKLRWKWIWTLHTVIIVNRSTKEYTMPKKITAVLIKKMNLRKLHERLGRVLKNTPFDKSEMAANFLAGWKEKEIIPKSILGKPTLYAFEDAQLYGPARIDEYLTHVYGDYMQLPPVEERVYRHNYPVLKLDVPFREYELK